MCRIIYIYIYVYVYVCLCVCICIYIYMYVYICICVCMCMCVYVYICILDHANQIEWFLRNKLHFSLIYMLSIRNFINKGYQTSEYWLVQWGSWLTCPNYFINDDVLLPRRLIVTIKVYIITWFPVAPKLFWIRKMGN